ncbi:MAG TPA: choice-of-anchor H family protein [Woeseiaceae bacterium]|nr:choice-of-anchor H family protein [Woeseiaceae bacterium]
MNTRTLSTRFIYRAALTLLLMSVTVITYANDQPEMRISTTSQGQGIERGAAGKGVVSHDELEPLVTEGERTTTPRVAGQQKLSGTAAQSGSLDFWIYDADVDLYGDLDRDGYYTGVDLLFDADTTYAVADVYAVIYLSYDFGPWNEYVTTQDFTIFGASGSDEYIVDTELVSGYPTGDYDILIELFDAYDGTFLTSFGPEDSSELSYLPLEDIGRDTPRDTTIVVTQGGGAVSWLLLLAVFGVAAMRQRAA